MLLDFNRTVNLFFVQCCRSLPPIWAAVVKTDQGYFDLNFSHKRWGSELAKNVWRPRQAWKGWQGHIQRHIVLQFWTDRRYSHGQRLVLDIISITVLYLPGQTAHVIYLLVNLHFQLILLWVAWWSNAALCTYMFIKGEDRWGGVMVVQWIEQ